VFVQRQIGDHAPEARILLAQLPQVPQFGHTQVGVLLLPDIKRRFTDAELLTDIRGWRAGLVLA
jgi:hypothetical protein